MAGTHPAGSVRVKNSSIPMQNHATNAGQGTMRDPGF